MYIIFDLVRNRRFNNKTFDTYDQARCYVRKWVRANYLGGSSYPYSNPTLFDAQFSVRKVV